MSENETDRETEKRKAKPVFRLQPAELLTGDESLQLQLQKLKAELITKTEEVESFRENLLDSEADVDRYHDALMRIASGAPTSVDIAREALDWNGGLKADDDDNSVDVTADLDAP
jgi:hypothetical protein